MTASVDDLDDVRRGLFATLPAAAADLGWTEPALARAAREAGFDEALAAAAFPDGVLGALAALSAHLDARAAATITETDLAAMRIRDRVAFAVKTRLEAEGNREAVRRAAARLAMPDALGAGPRILFATADALWRAVGDRSTDVNYYSKRALLAGVYAATTAVWARGDDEAAWRTLDARIANVMTIEKVKSRLPIDAAAKASAGLFGALGALRHGRR